MKTIFPKGAAIEDGHLQRGDRLLTVNTIDVTQMTLQETVALLRDTRIGETVEMSISRQREGSVPQDLVRTIAEPLQTREEIVRRCTRICKSMTIYRTRSMLT